MYPDNSLRMKEFQRCLSGNGLDAYVISGTLELGFLTGFHLDGCMMLAGRKRVWVFLPEMLLEQFKSEVDFCEAVSSDNLAVSIIKKAAGEGFKKVGFDSDNETFKRGMLWKKHRFVEKPGLISSMREVKKGREIESLKKSCRIAAKAIKVMAGRIRPGRTERYREEVPSRKAVGTRPQIYRERAVDAVYSPGQQQGPSRYGAFAGGCPRERISFSIMIACIQITACA